MTSTKRYEILDHLPAYGPMYIPISEDNEPYFSEGFPIRFFKTDGTDWIANFKPGWTDLNQVFDFPQHDRIIVFAGGLGYIMSPNNEKPIGTIGFTINEIFQTENGSLVCVDGISIAIIDNLSGLIWQSERISWDGFKDLKLVGDMISGLTYDPTNSINNWTAFTFNIKTREIIGGSYRESVRRNPNMTDVQSRDKNQNKSWWTTIK